MKVVSVIIPVYNVADYLHKCLNSLLEQGCNLLELILINDGSTDDSLSICYEFQKQYPDTIIVDKKNGGLSDARNEGVKLASCDYIYFLDSDDWLAPDAILKLYNFAIQANCEIVQGGVYYAYDTYLEYDNRWVDDSLVSFTLNRSQAMKELVKNSYIGNFAWGKIYKTSIVKQYLFKVGVYFEDAYWQYLIINEANNYGVIIEPLYFYRQRNTSISGCFSLKNLDLLKGYEERLDFIKNNYSAFLPDAANSFWNLSLSFYRLSGKSLDEKVKSGFEHYWKDINSKYLSMFQFTIKHASVRSRLHYYLAFHSSMLLSVLVFIERVWKHFFFKPLKKVKIDEA